MAIMRAAPPLFPLRENFGRNRPEKRKDAVKDEKEILALTGLRFVAALYVFIFHMHIRWPITETRLLKNILDQGAIGMSLFFMLSGFVLAYRYADGKTSVKSYFANRFARIYPIYMTAALVTLPWIGLSWGNGSFHEAGKAMGQGLLLVAANILMIQAWFPQFFDYWNDGGSWSLSVEAFCYALLPFLLPALTRMTPKKLMLMALACYVLAVMPGLTNVIFPGAPRGVYYSMPIYRLPEFLIGVCCFLAIQGQSLKRFNQWFHLAVAGLFVAYLALVGPRLPDYVGHNWITVPFIAYTICVLAKGKSILASCLSAPLFVWLGRISYCFYSFQALVILFLISRHDGIVKAIPPLASNRIFMLSALLILIALSALGYYLIEEPARRKIRKACAARSARSPLLARPCDAYPVNANQPNTCSPTSSSAKP